MSSTSTTQALANKSNSPGRKQFESPQEEIAYLQAKLEENQSEFQEFQESSRELETEYETQIKHLEKKNHESSHKLDRLEFENEQFKSRYNAYTLDTQHRLNEYQQQIAELTTLNDRLTSYIRELEQNNDDLERARRTLAASLEDFEAQLNQQIERNVLLENEVSEKEELECVVQRLKEEARDLRHELVVRTNSTNNESARRKQLLMESYLSNAQRDSSLLSLSSNRFESAIENQMKELGLNGNQQDRTNSSDAIVQTDTLIEEGKDSPSVKPQLVDSTTNPMTPLHSSTFSFSTPPTDNSDETSSSIRTTDTKSQQTSTPSSPKLPPSILLTPSTRLSALNIVSDLLRKVGALESKLSTTTTK